MADPVPHLGELSMLQARVRTRRSLREKDAKGVRFRYSSAWPWARRIKHFTGSKEAGRNSKVLG